MKNPVHHRKGFGEKGGVFAKRSLYVGGGLKKSREDFFPMVKRVYHHKDQKKNGEI